MSKLWYMMWLFCKYILILWVPVLLIEETFLLDYFGDTVSIICFFLMSIVCLFIYIKDYKKGTKKINCYVYNIVNAILLIVSNLGLGVLFFEFIEWNIFHQCMGDGWACFLFGIEYIVIGMWYAFCALVVLLLWLIVRLIKFLKVKLNSK